MTQNEYESCTTPPGIVRHLPACSPYSTGRLWWKQRSNNECAFIGQRHDNCPWRYRYHCNAFANIDTAHGDFHTDKTESDAGESHADANGNQGNSHSHAFKIDADTIPDA